jgi:hypothetical protein
MRRKKIHHMLLIFSFLNVPVITMAQESIIPNISYTYLEKLISTAQKNYPEVMAKSYQTAIAKTTLLKQPWGGSMLLTYPTITAQTMLLILLILIYFNGYQVGVNINVGTLLQKAFCNKGS